MPSLPIRKNCDKGKCMKTAKITLNALRLSLWYVERAVGKQRRELLTLPEGIKGDFAEDMTLDFGPKG